MKFLTKADKVAWAAHLAQLDAHRRGLLSTPRNADERRLLKHGFRVCSQADEDGILREIFRRIGETNRMFVELGAAEGIENNTLFLLLQGWQGIWIEGSEKKAKAARNRFASEINSARLAIEQRFLTPANIEEVLHRHKSAPKEIDLLSIDLDGNDYYILEAIESVSPRVILAEYNAKFPPDVVWVMEYNEHHRYDSTDYFGASLKAFELMLSARGYTLVGCNLLGTNAFFVRADLAKDPPFCSPFTAENHYEPPRYYLRHAFDSGIAAGFGPGKFGELPGAHR
jgi:hypothetical protein